MQKTKLFVSLLTIFLAIALVGGATMAWFTDSASIEPNEFEAGTVKISADDTGNFAAVPDNWNPGDWEDYEICIENEGSKGIRLRMKIDDHWIPRNKRLLVLYHDGITQLLSLDWEDSYKGCIATDEPLATGVLSIDKPSPRHAYLQGEFTALNDQTWLELNKQYDLWCVDSSTTIGVPSSKSMTVFDPYCYPNWYEYAGVDDNEQWQDIPWHLVYFIINEDYINSPDHGEDNFTVMDVQQAIWYFTNGDFLRDNSENPLNVTKAGKIRDHVLANAALPTDNVRFDLGDDWRLEDGWYYYIGEVIEGERTFEVIEGESRFCFNIKITLDGSTTGNEYQGAQYWLKMLFEAVQASNDAPFEKWGTELYPRP